jgi:hypothetical protein
MGFDASKLAFIVKVESVKLVKEIKPAGDLVMI